MAEPVSTLHEFRTMIGGSSGLEPAQEVVIDFREVVAVKLKIGAHNGRPYGCIIFTKEDAFHVNARYSIVVALWEEAKGMHVERHPDAKQVYDFEDEEKKKILDEVFSNLQRPGPG